MLQFIKYLEKKKKCCRQGVKYACTMYIYKNTHKSD